MQIKNQENIAVLRADSINNLKEGLNYVRDKTNTIVLILSFVDEKNLAKKNGFDEQLIEQIKTFPIPVITIIKNSAKGLIFEIILASHLCIATASAKFEINNIEDVQNQIGSTNVKKLKSAQNPTNAENALDLGFINIVAAFEDVEKEAYLLAEKIANLAPLAIRSCLQAVSRGLEMDLENGLKLETELFEQIFATEDMKEGTQAFLEKRKPIFKGK